MKSVIMMEVRRFPVLVVKQDNQEPYARHIVLTKNQLQAAQTVGQSSKELIQRICKKQGYKVLEIGKPEKRSIALDLDFLWDAEDFVRECESGVW
jgi:hypothetical protein